MDNPQQFTNSVQRYQIIIINNRNCQKKIENYKKQVMRRIEVDKKDIKDYLQNMKKKQCKSQKMGLSLVSCQTSNQLVSKQRLKYHLAVNQENQNNNERRQRQPLRSLSAQRNRWKKIKMLKKNKFQMPQNNRDLIKGHLNQLQNQYDQIIKNKRQELFSRFSNKNNKSQVPLRYSEIDTKQRMKIIDKCVPTSKISLIQMKNCKSVLNLIKINESQAQPNSDLLSLLTDKKERRNSTSSSSFSLLQASCVSSSKSMLSNGMSKSNLQVVPIGSSISKNLSFEKSIGPGSSSKKKGISVLSNKKMNNMTMSLRLERQNQRQVQLKESHLIQISQSQIYLKMQKSKNLWNL